MNAELQTDAASRYSIVLTCFSYFQSMAHFEVGVYRILFGTLSTFITLQGVNCRSGSWKNHFHSASSFNTVVARAVMKVGDLEKHENCGGKTRRGRNFKTSHQFFHLSNDLFYSGSKILTFCTVRQIETMQIWVDVLGALSLTPSNLANLHAIVGRNIFWALKCWRLNIHHSTSWNQEAASIPLFWQIDRAIHSQFATVPARPFAEIAMQNVNEFHGLSRGYFLEQLWNYLWFAKISLQKKDEGLCRRTCSMNYIQVFSL